MQRTRGPCSYAFLELRQEPPHRLAAMAKEVLLALLELGGRLVEIAQVEMRVVAEAVGAARLRQDLARPARLGDDRLRVLGVAHQHNHAVVVGAPVVLAVQQGDQLLVVAQILGLAPRRRPRLRRAGEPRRMHARPSVQRANADARVVRERGQAGAPARVTRLGEGVLDERSVGLLGLRDFQGRLRDDLDPERTEQGLELAQLAWIGRREDQLLHRRAPAWVSASAAFCLATSSAMPRWASAISACISPAEKGAPSAVPCTSTKPPEPVITTFMSVSQWESSS